MAQYCYSAFRVIINMAVMLRYLKLSYNAIITPSAKELAQVGHLRG